MERTLSTLLASIYLASALSGCYRYHLSPEAEDTEARIERLRTQGRITEACELAGAAEQSSASSMSFRAECLEKRSRTAADNDRKEALALYRKAAECGSRAAQSSLQRLGGGQQELKYGVGKTSIPLFDTRPAYCGLEREVTPTGWAVAPVGVPAYFVAGAAAVGVVVGLIGVAAVMFVAAH